MTRLPRNGNGGPARKLAAVHTQSGQHRVVVAEARNGDLSVVLARTVTGTELGTTLSQVTKEHKLESILRVAPGSETVCRCIELPEGDAAAAGAALPLLAEAELPESLPPHRRAAGVIPGAATSGARLGLLTGWQNGADAPEALTQSAEESWVAEIAALALLRGESGVAMYADRKDGAIALIAGGPKRTIARILVEDGHSASAWAGSVRTAAKETCQAAGLDRAPVPEVSDITLELDDRSISALKSRVSGMRDEGRWLDEYGIALGAILVAADHDPLTPALATMTADGRAHRVPAWERAANWLGKPKHAWGLAAAAVLLMLLGPLGIAWGRLAILNAKSGALEAGREERARLESQAALYAQLEQLRWPMSKLMADIAGATPVGIVVDDLRLGTDLGVSVHGTAQNLDQLYTFQRNLATSRIFKEVKINRSEASGSGVEFDLAADVSSPHITTKPAEDFGSRPLAVRLYGDGASNTTRPVAHSSPSSSRPTRTARSEDREDAGEPRASAPPRETSGNGNGNSSTTSTTSRRPQATPDVIPAPLTEEQIAAMDRATAMKEWVSRKTYPQKNPSIDAATKERLLDEATKLQTRMEQTKGGGS